MKEMIVHELENFYNGTVPGDIVNAGRTFLTINIADWEGQRILKITLADVILYYATEARNMMSGIRTLAGYCSDWRPVDNLAHEALEWFKYINRPQLAREAEKRGMTLKG
jgi:cytochrome c oxidase assembly factor CtaG